jgi:hypothetical protein
MRAAAPYRAPYYKALWFKKNAQTTNVTGMVYRFGGNALFPLRPVAPQPEAPRNEKNLPPRRGRRLQSCIGQPRVRVKAYSSPISIVTCWFY